MSAEEEKREITAEEKSRPQRKAALFLDDTEKFTFDFGVEEDKELSADTGRDEEAGFLKRIKEVQENKELSKEEELACNTTLVREAAEKGRHVGASLLTAEVVAQLAADNLRATSEKLFTFENVWTAHAREKYLSDKRKREKTEDKKTSEEEDSNSLTLRDACVMFSGSLRRYNDASRRSLRAKQKEKNEALAKQRKRTRDAN
ncbi:hypothetical protein AGDE_15622 [Angomonas deanei]|uniref:Uncharacterized protein n=1 Tax=Angomonas deanei TaxID=59799 RepID=A0A7G2CLP2_9TRYP|nr:hypothetical protein AGDE_15622 [Angomonas deanei]CAD2220768.1 hypothetical protein, conserved [Angomonas deanei]|eukprot:EPY18753.1 hypothetical protein AGDE_15622 [Angomonas deanei]